MTKTTNYQLNQWAKSDRIQMEDFNADNAKIDAALAGMASTGLKIATGSYTGTGTYGSSNPNTLTLPFSPKLLFVYANANESDPNWFFWGPLGKAHGSEYCNETLSVSGNTVSWYISNGNANYNNESYQLNYSGRVYAYLAIG